MSRTDLVDGPVWACRTFSRGARPQIAAAYPPPATPELAWVGEGCGVGRVTWVVCGLVWGIGLRLRHQPGACALIH